MKQHARIIVIGAGVGGLTTAALLAKAGYDVTVYEAQTYPGGSASTYYYQGYQFDSGATVAGGFQPNGPHTLLGEMLEIDWSVRQHDPAWVVHLAGEAIPLMHDNSAVLARFPHTAPFWDAQVKIADLSWKLAASGLPWLPQDVGEWMQLARTGLRHFPADLRLVPYAFKSVQQWLQRLNLTHDAAFVRFIDAMLLISAQTATPYANALYGATALDLPRQGVYHVAGGIGGIAETLVQRLQADGGSVHYRHHVTRIVRDGKRITGVEIRHGKRGKTQFVPADFVIANVTPWSLATLLGDPAPQKLQREVRQRNETYGAFVLHVGVRADSMPDQMADHHQIIPQLDGEMGEGNSLFVSLSPKWDTSRAPDGHRAVTISTHTNVSDWWRLLETDRIAYDDRKAEYTERIMNTVNAVIPGFKTGADIVLPGTPVTFERYTLRQRGMVGGFPQTSLFKARSPRTGLPNLRLVGDSIFPGQSTAGVTLGGIRVARDVIRNQPLEVPSHRAATSTTRKAHES